MSGLRIGILTHNYPLWEGESRDAGRFVYIFARELLAQKRVEKVCVFCPFFQGEKETSPKIPVTWFRWFGGGFKLGNLSPMNPVHYLRVFSLLASGSMQIDRFVRENDLDFLIVFWNFPSGVYALFSKWTRGTPYVTWALGSDIFVHAKFPIASQLVWLVLRNAKKNYGNSYKINDEIYRLAGVKADFLPTSNPIVIGRAKKPSLGRGSFNFLYLGRLEVVKGPDVLLEAARILNKKGVDFCLTMIGGGTMQGELEERVREYKLEGRVKIMGYVKDQAVVNGYLTGSDALVIPSRSESFPLVITEALQTGLPVVGTDVGDIKTFVQKHRLGFVCVPEKPEALAGVMLKMVGEGKKIREKRAKDMKKIYKNFELRTSVNTIMGEVGR